MQSFYLLSRLVLRWQYMWLEGKEGEEDAEIGLGGDT